MKMSVDGLPEGLATALAERKASITQRWQEGARSYLRAESPESPVFGRFSTDPRDVSVLAHEARVRAVVGERGVLRSPSVLDAGPGWLLEVAVDTHAPLGLQSAELIVAAAGELARLDLPDGPGGPPPGSVRRLRARLAFLRSEVPLADLLRARRVITQSPLVPVSSHGDFQPTNVLLADGWCWVIDWELSCRRPAGYDLMQYWTSAGEEEREILFEGAVALVGSDSRHELVRLRYAVTVQTVAGMLGNLNDFDRDVARGSALLRSLAQLRREAGF